jgi:hypothetical protein
VVERHVTHEVPRRIRYELGDRWRPLVVLLVLAAWWEWRHGGPDDHALASDLEGLGYAIAPLVHAPTALEGARIRWIADAADSTSTVIFVASGGRLRAHGAESALPSGAEDAHVSATPGEWCTALISGGHEGLRVTGDAALAIRLGTAVRDVLLRPLRNAP